MNKEIMDKISVFQKNEITEYFIYTKLSESSKGNNREVLRRIAEDELKHYNLWKKYSRKDIAPDTFKVWKYFLISKIFGLTFGVKLMEKGEQGAQVAYNAVSKDVPEAEFIAHEEDGHEKELIAMIDEERLKYVGSIVLGLNDALVELTGALAGLTFALQNTRLVATAGLITGIAASLSMAASEYLSTKSEEAGKNPLKASVYTGIAYVFTVLFLIFPFLVFKYLYLCLGVSLLNAVIVIYLFTFYVSIAKDVPFRKRFTEMAAISLGIAAISFFIGLLVRHFLRIDV
ncbi:MAG: VIT1/CCC1 transporter family protein [Candidatus Omnitrophica bacterium]|nr:VIT1/CCC1 transporter family protein [Candidatus Omnitrophota bacterium]